MQRSRIPRLFRLTVVLVTPLVLGQACGAGWRQPAAIEPRSYPPRQQVQVWQNAHELRWHGVTITSESISGVPHLMPLTCDSCRVTILRSDIDSLRLGNPVAGFRKTVGLVVGAAWIVGYCTLYRCWWD
jgi:hypothetical protein